MSRMLKFAGAALALALTLTSIAGTAQAVVYTITITGTVTGGFDAEGLFGGGSLTGRGARGVFQVDTAKGAFFDGGSDQDLSGFDVDNPVSSSLEILGEPPHVLPSAEAFGRIVFSEFAGGQTSSPYRTTLTDRTMLGGFNKPMSSPCLARPAPSVALIS